MKAIPDYRTTEQWAIFCRAIGEQPGDDTVRLVAADWLDETAGTAKEPCETCKRPGETVNHVPGHIFVGWGHGWQPCTQCKGNEFRWVSDGRAERAEFIRVQCELASVYPDSESHHGDQWNALCEREWELFDRFGRSWFPPPNDNWQVWLSCSPPGELAAERPQVFEIRRGFVATVRGPLAAMIGGECGRCSGDGHLYYAEPPADEDTPCPDCHGTGRTPGCLAGLGAELWAVETATPTDCTPWADAGHAMWGWWERNDYHEEDGSLLDRELMLEMADARRSDHGISVRFTKDSPPGGCILFRSEADARATLSAGILRLSRERAGLDAGSAASF